MTYTGNEVITVIYHIHISNQNPVCKLESLMAWGTKYSVCTGACAAIYTKTENKKYVGTRLMLQYNGVDKRF